MNKRATDGLHHFMNRKNKNSNNEENQSPSNWKKILDKCIYVVGIIGPIMTLPQVHMIWINHKVEGVSLVSWSAYLIIAIFWISYGLAHKEWPIIITNALFLILDAVIVVGIILYG
jgi:uncharacterized protein with PQ loop repeat